MGIKQMKSQWIPCDCHHSFFESYASAFQAVFSRAEARSARNLEQDRTIIMTVKCYP
jgi:hypothetical protein